MSSAEVVVACCQVPLTIGDPAGNRALLAEAVEDAAGVGANIVVLPELAATGYCVESRAELEMLAEPTDGTTVSEWHRLAAAHDLVIVGGFIEAAEDGRVFNSAVLVDWSGPRACYRKVHLWDREGEWFCSGDAPPPVVSTRYGDLGVVICYDLEFPEWVRMAALAGAQLLCAPVNWPLFARPEAERPSEVVKVQADASVNRIFVAACDRTRTERGTQWLGGSVVVDPDGYPRTRLQLGEDGNLLARIDLGEATNKTTGSRNDVFLDRRPELYHQAPLQPFGS